MTRHPPRGQLDIWIPVDSFGQVLGLPEQTTKDLLRTLPVLEISATDNRADCIVRLQNQQAAESVAAQLRDWFQQHPGFDRRDASSGA